MTDIAVIGQRVSRMRQAATKRDQAMRDLAKVRMGDIDALMPSVFSDDLPKSLAANFIDTAARDLSELMAPLPTFSVNDESATTQAQKDRESKKTNVGYAYWYMSKLQKQMYTACDQYISNGFLPFKVEPDYDTQMPVIYAMDPVGSYYTLDRRGRCTTFAHVMTKPTAELAEMWPEHAAAIMGPEVDEWGRSKPRDGEHPLEIVQYEDKDTITCYLPERKNLILDQVPNPLGRCAVVVVERPYAVRGQFDDAIPVQMARAMMARLGIDAAWKSVNAPLAIPDDVNQIAIGPDAIIRSRNPEKIRRVGMELPPGAFQSEALLEAELRMGTRYPDARSGDMQASIITGRGVQALQGTIDTQIKTAQDLLGNGLAEITAFAFELDEKVWPDLQRHVQASMQGIAIDEKYVPSKDFKGDYRCDCVYGFAAGLGVNQAVVLIEQMINGGLIARATGRRHLPLGEDPIKLEREVTVQQIRDGLQQGVTAMAQSVNVIVEQGGDPSSLLLKIAGMVGDAQQGIAIEDAVKNAFPPPPPAPPADPNAPPGAPGQGPPGQPGAPGAPPGMNALTGLPQGTAAAGQAPGGRPSLQQLVAGLSSNGQANLSDNATSRVPSLG